MMIATGDSRSLAGIGGWLVRVPSRGGGDRLGFRATWFERQHGGPTDVANLAPLKPRLHRLKTVTRIRLDPKPDGGIRVRTPTGYDSDPPPF
ncbi:hypothetical protein GCM10027415_31290 [Humibacter ginsengisoli]